MSVDEDTEPGADARRRACEDLARWLATDEGLRQVRLLQALEIALPGTPSPTAAPAAPADPRLPAALASRSRPKAPAAPLPIGPWRPQAGAGGLRFVRDAPPGLGDPWPPHAELTPKRADGPRRICFLGESAAAGWFYAPHLTPALVLERQLAALGAPFEVVNLAKVDLSAPELLGLLGSVHQLQPDVLVVYAGNNWPQRYQAPPPGAPGSAETAAAFRADGFAGVQRMAERATARLAGEVVARLARLASDGGVPVIVVVPEANLADFDRSAPPSWLPGADLAQWHALAETAAGHLDAGAPADAEGLARRMIALDGGRAPGAQRLLCRALAAQGRLDEAALAARAEIDARAWDNHPFVPTASSAVLRVLRTEAPAQGLRVVDLPELFAAHGGTPLPGRRYFLDYCHLTPEGMAVSMAAVAAEVLALQGAAPGWREVLAAAPAPEVAPEREARARFMAALYTRHWTDTDAPAPAFTHWIEAALEAAPEAAAAVMRGYAATRCVPAPALLFSSGQQELFAGVDRSERHIWSAPHLDPEALRAIAAALARRGAPLAAEVEAALLRHHGVGARPLDLLRSTYHWGLTDQPRANSSLRHHPPAFYAARAPRAHFCLVTEGGRPVQLALTARLPRVQGPRAGTLGVMVEGEPVGSVELDHGWGQHTVTLPGDALRRGINRLTLRWPAPPPEGEAALAHIGLRLDQRVGVDIHPVFGQVMELRARILP